MMQDVCHLNTIYLEKITAKLVFAISHVAVENFYQTIKQLKALQPFAKKWYHFCENLKTLRKKSGIIKGERKKPKFHRLLKKRCEKCRTSATSVATNGRCVKTLPLSPSSDRTLGGM